MPIPKQDSSAANAVTSKQGFDIDAVGQHDGKDIFDVDLESFDDKPWRKPGADITDYFNYGLNENTWKAYCQKQKMMRDQAMMHSNVTHFLSIQCEMHYHSYCYLIMLFWNVYDSHMDCRTKKSISDLICKPLLLSSECLALLSLLILFINTSAFSKVNLSRTIICKGRP